MNDDPYIANSARKHGVSDDDILHAYRCAMRAEAQDERTTMLVGPSRSAHLLEICVVQAEAGPVIVHAMTARAKYLR